MKYRVAHDSLGTHFDWSHDGLCRVVIDPRRNPFTHLSVEGRGRNAVYQWIN
jgi:hypothetical protein